MAYPTTGRFNKAYPGCHTPSLGASPIAAALRIPFRCQIETLTATTAGTITSTDCVVTVKLNGTTITSSTNGITVTATGADAGQTFSNTPLTQTIAQEGDVLLFTPASASGTTIPGTFTAILRSF